MKTIRSNRPSTAVLKKATFVVCLILSALVGFGQAGNGSFEKIYSLTEAGNYFKAKEVYSLEKNNLPEEYQKYVEAVLDNAFNQVEESQQKIASLIGGQTGIPDSLRFKLYEIKGDNAIKTFNYEEAKDAVSVILNRYNGYLSEKEKEDFENDLKVWSALEDVPRQKVTVSRNTVLKIEKDIAGLNNLEVSAGCDTVNFIFDTGANLSTVCRSVAERFKMKILPADIKVGAITGAKVSAQLAVCDKICLGNIEAQNVVFLVLPDEALSFPEANYRISGILGFPVIEGLKEIRITRDGYFIVPKEETEFTGISNMAMNGLTPLIYIEGKHYTFDTGADRTMLYRSFYLANREEIDKNHKPGKVSFGGAGGIVELGGFVIDQTFNVSGRNVTVTDVHLLKEKIKDDETVYGNIGQDFIRQFDKMTMNFSRMFIQFE